MDKLSLRCLMDKVEANGGGVALADLLDAMIDRIEDLERWRQAGTCETPTDPRAPGRLWQKKSTAR